MLILFGLSCKSDYESSVIMCKIIGINIWLIITLFIYTKKDLKKYIYTLDTIVNSLTSNLSSSIEHASAHIGCYAHSHSLTQRGIYKFTYFNTPPSIYILFHHTNFASYNFSNKNYPFVLQNFAYQVLYFFFISYK